MKTTNLLISVFFLLLILGCNREKKISELLEDNNTRTEVFNEILNDEALLAKFMDDMHKHRTAMRMLSGHSGMMGDLMNWNNMQEMMGTETMRRKMMMWMAQDSLYRENLYKMMRDKTYLKQGSK